MSLHYLSLMALCALPHFVLNPLYSCQRVCLCRCQNITANYVYMLICPWHLKTIKMVHALFAFLIHAILILYFLLALLSVCTELWISLLFKTVYWKGFKLCITSALHWLRPHNPFFCIPKDLCKLAYETNTFDTSLPKHMPYNANSNSLHKY